jgi:hypothetical protein
VLREDAGFHAYQMLEAGVRQFAVWGDTDEGRHILIAVARYLAAHSPTERAALQPGAAHAFGHRPLSAPPVSSAVPNRSEDVRPFGDIRLGGIKRWILSEEVYCPPGLNGRQIMSALDQFLGENPQMAGRPYGDALAVTLSWAFPCQALSTCSRQLIFSEKRGSSPSIQFRHRPLQ